MASKLEHASPGPWLSRSLAVGLLLAAVSAAVLVVAQVHWLSFDTVSPAMRVAIGGSCMAAAATALGTLPVVCAQAFSQRTYDGFLGFGAGVMLGATAFSLVVPALHAARVAGAGALAASSMVGGGIALGALAIIALGWLVDRFLHPDLPDSQMSSAQAYRRIWLFVAAITLHNLPEGVAIGVAAAGPDLGPARSLATAISIQDVPEGMVVALALRSAGHGRLFSAALGVLSGLVEPLAAVAGVALISYALGFLPLGLATAAGAMLYVIVHEVIPESHRHGNGAVASLSLVAGFSCMTILDTAL